MNDKSNIPGKPSEAEDLLIRDIMRLADRSPRENPWFHRRVMASLPDKKERRATTLATAQYIIGALVVLGAWVAGGVWFLSHDVTLLSLGVLCCIPLTTLFSGAVVAAPALKKILN